MDLLTTLVIAKEPEASHGSKFDSAHVYNYGSSRNSLSVWSVIFLWLEDSLRRPESTFQICSQISQETERLGIQMNAEVS